MNLIDIVNIVKQIKSSEVIKSYIDFIRFPFYRNLEPDTIINFDFPLTVFIGQNGCGKSSCLHAIQGAPENYTPFKFWFDTKVDPIEYYDDAKKRHSFWYSFIDESGTKREVIKARIKRNDDPNYSETSRPLVWAGMQKRDDGKRDTPIKKNVVYIDFRSELSAFDKYYYFGDTKNLSARNKQEFIRGKSTSLRKILSKEEVSIKNRAGDVNKPLRELTNEELQNISFILGKEYTSGKYVEHNFFRNHGYSIYFSTTHAGYSEAFAGSGEVAVTRLVLQVMDAQPYSLILLDEPEVSLHPGAQHRLKLFLLEQIKINKHQIIICTHSPSLIKGLPKESIKAFVQNPQSGRFEVKENVSPEEAFYYIEQPIDDKKNIIVEDILAKLILEGVLEKMGQEVINLFNVTYYPGGESVLHKEYASIFSRETNSNKYIFFDGDQKPIENIALWSDFTQSEITVANLQKIIRKQTNTDVKFSVDSGSNKIEQTIELQKKYLDYYKSNVFYIPKQIPEELIWDDIYAEKLVRISIIDEAKANQLIDNITNSESYKDKFAKLSEVIYSDSNSQNILAVQKMFVKYWISLTDDDYNQIVNDINNIIGG